MPPCKGLIPWCPKSQGDPLPLGCTNFVSNAHITMFTLFKVFMAKCILIIFLYQSDKTNKQVIMTCLQLSTPAEKSSIFNLNSFFYLFLFRFLFFLDTDPLLVSVVCDLYLFSILRYELCVCGNLCTCVRVSTNLESPPTMGNFKV